MKNFIEKKIFECGHPVEILGLGTKIMFSIDMQVYREPQ